MRLIESLKKKKFLLFNIFFTLYIGINLIGGERGLISYFDKKNTHQKLQKKDKELSFELTNLDHKILLINVFFEVIVIFFVQLFFRKSFEICVSSF